MKVWIVLPAYNEEAALPPLLESLFEAFSEINREAKVIVVDDGSSDGTWKILNEYAKKFPVVPVQNEKNSGLAETIKRGLMEAAKVASPKDIILTMDADNTHPAGLGLRMCRLVMEGNDVVIASRYQRGSYVKGVPLHRKLLSDCASILFRIMFPIRGVRDYTCGYRAYRASTIQKLWEKYGDQFVSERGFSCMVDILLRLRQMDLIFTEVPLVLRYDLKPTLSKMKVLRTIRDTLFLMGRRRLGIE